MSERRDFGLVASNTHCPFAAKANIVWAQGICDYDIEQYVSRNINEFLEFCQISLDGKLDGFIFSFNGSIYGEDLQGVSLAVKSILDAIALYDDFARLSMAGDFLSDDWRLMICDNVFTIIAFSPCYPPENSRYSFGAENVFLLFQPVSAFAKYSDPTTGRLPVGLKETIRERFSNLNRRYDPELSSHLRSHALRFVRPLHYQDSPVEWWV